MLMSIIIPMYNSENTIAKCLKSVKKQRSDDYEVIVVDDGSNDKTLEVVRKVIGDDKRFRVICEKNHGVSYARNNGLRKSRGDYIAFLDSDDCLKKEYIEECTRLIRNTNADIIKFSYVKKMGPYRKRHKYSRLIGLTTGNNTITDIVYDQIFCNNDFSNIWTMVVKADIAKNNSFEQYEKGEDFLYSIRCVGRAKSLYLSNKVLYEYNINLKSITHCFMPNRVIEEIEALKTIAKETGTQKQFQKVLDRVVDDSMTESAICNNYRGYVEYLDYIKSKGLITASVVQQEAKRYYKKRLLNIHKVIMRKMI